MERRNFIKKTAVAGTFSLAAGSALFGFPLNDPENKDTGGG
ncbi:MAG: twin-arginine translocation signal domain-containing protein, partial [Bacteroidales bacterium]|nr:twin-arginine translocation signal domain-containing protein [Bacteroidales bacterium]